MINPHKGDLPFEAGGEQYVLCYSHRSLVLLEEKLDKGLMKIMKEIDTWKTNPEDMRLGTICALLWAGLQKHHPTMTMDGVSEIMDGLDGGASRAIELLGEGFQRAFSAPGTKGNKPSSEEGEWSWDRLFVEHVSLGYEPDEFWEITPRELKLLTEAAAKRHEREHNARAWMAWHIAAFQRMKRMPDLKKLYLNQTSRPRQSWRQQLAIMNEWAAARKLAKKELTDGR